jgi:hypothetical protein
MVVPTAGAEHDGNLLSASTSPAAQQPKVSEVETAPLAKNYASPPGRKSLRIALSVAILAFSSALILYLCLRAPTAAPDKLAVEAKKREGIDSKSSASQVSAPMHETFSFRGVSFGDGIERTPELLKQNELRKSDVPEWTAALAGDGNPEITEQLGYKCNGLDWYKRPEEQSINGVGVEIYYGFYKDKLTKIMVFLASKYKTAFDPQAIDRWKVDGDAVREALIAKYGRQDDLSKYTKGARQQPENLTTHIDTINGPWDEQFPAPLPTGAEKQSWLNARGWWLIDDRVLMSVCSLRCTVEIKDVPLLMDALKAAEQAYHDQKAKKALNSAKNDF